VNKDIDLIFTKIRGLVGEDADMERMNFMVHKGAPVSKSRARWSAKSRRFYTPANTANGERDLIATFQENFKGNPITGCVAIAAIFYRPNFQRIDTDNLMKLVMDAATKAGVWKDDCYVTAQASFIEFDPDNPRTVVAVCDAKSTMDRDRRFTCTVCGSLFDRKGRAALKKPPKFCSKKCDLHWRAQERAEVRCPGCDQVFRRGVCWC
jgi:Holliday junction resolvase RusA-like endonuclease